MKINKVSLSKEEAEKLWDEIDTKKQDVFDREKDADKLEQMFVRIGDAFTNQIVQANSETLEEARLKLTTGTARELKKFNKNIEKAKEVIKKDVTDKSTVAHFLRAAKLSSSGKISKNHFVATLVEGAEFEKQGLKWLNFNKYTGPIIPPRESKMLRPSTTLAPERKLTSEEQFRRSKIVIAFKPDQPRERPSVQKPRASAQPQAKSKEPEGKGNLTGQKIDETEEETDKDERITALQAEKDRLARELDVLQQQVRTTTEPDEMRGTTDGS